MFHEKKDDEKEFSKLNLRKGENEEGIIFEEIPHP